MPTNSAPEQSPSRRHREIQSGFKSSPAKTVLVLIDYFGQWPKWSGMFLKSCELNQTISWRIHTDCEIPDPVPANVTICRISAEDYQRRASTILGVRFRPSSMYRICDLRPMYGVLYADEIKGYDYFGWGDLDVLYGNLRSTYTDSVLTHNVICTNSRTCTGHLTLVKNDNWLREAFLLIPDWNRILEYPGPRPWRDCLDEARLSGLFSPRYEVRYKFDPEHAGCTERERYWRNNHFREYWTTPFVPGRWLDGSRRHPEVWYWANGCLTNEHDGKRQFPYLHFMNFKMNRYVDRELYENAETWEDLDELINFDCHKIGSRTIRIDRRGFHLT